MSDAASGRDTTFIPRTTHPSRQRRTAWLARSGHYIVNLNMLSAWLDLVTRLGAHFDVSESEDALPFDPLLSRR